jgi:hypothetical protein
MAADSKPVRPGWSCRIRTSTRPTVCTMVIVFPGCRPVIQKIGLNSQPSGLASNLTRCHELGVDRCCARIDKGRSPARQLGRCSVRYPSLPVAVAGLTGLAMLPRYIHDR